MRLLFLLAACSISGSLAFSTVSFSRLHSESALFASRQDTFAAFADSLEETLPAEESWQERLEHLMDPATPLAQRQILMSELLSANEEIRESVATALRDRKIDPLLTPTGRKLQDGTRAVARQLTTDILPNLAPPPPQDLPQIFPKIGSRILSALGSQAKSTLEEVEKDMRDPFRIPQRLSQLPQDFAKEARNVWSETPEGLQGPAYKVVGTGEGYEIREYEGYTVASTTMLEENPYDIASSGAAFNALASYLFGGNQEGRSMSMTTPVTTTNAGEMRFYLQETPAEPLEDSTYEKVEIVDIAPARLAVRRFTGFVTEGEVTRQKDALLSQLEIDGVELDVPHGAILPHVIFQYNPPYTIPILRRNEIAVPVLSPEESLSDLESEWGQEHKDDNSAPSDVE